MKSPCVKKIFSNSIETMVTTFQTETWIVRFTYSTIKYHYEANNLVWDVSLLKTQFPSKAQRTHQIIYVMIYVFNSL